MRYAATIATFQCIAEQIPIPIAILVGMTPVSCPVCPLLPFTNYNSESMPSVVRLHVLLCFGPIVTTLSFHLQNHHSGGLSLYEVDILLLDYPSLSLLLSYCVFSEKAEDHNL